MAIADTITSMQTHTSNAYTMLSYGTDLTGINKNLENLSSTIFEAFIESLRDSTTLYTNLPKINGNGTQITLNDTANAPMRITLNPTAISQDGTPTPDSPQDIHTISGDNTIEVKNKNILGIDFYDSYYGMIVEIKNGIVRYYGGGSTGANSPSYAMKLPNNTQLTMSMNYVSGTLTAGSCVFNIKFYNSNNELVQTLKSNDITKNNYTSQIVSNITLTEDIEYIRVWLQQYQATIDGDLIYQVQLEKGTTATSFIAPSTQTAPINLGNIEYCKIGNYEDEFIYNTTDTNLELNKWYLKKNIGKVQLSDSWNWGTQGTQNFQVTLIGANKLSILVNATGFSNYFPVKSSGTDIYIYPIMQTGTDYIRISNAVNKWETTTDFKTWLSNNETYLYYPKEPTYTQITGTLETQLNNIYKNMLSYKGTTNVSQTNNDLPFVLGVSAIQDLE